MLHITTTNKKGHKLVCNGYIYRIAHNNALKTTSWGCVKRSADSPGGPCRARVTTSKVAAHLPAPEGIKLTRDVKTPHCHAAPTAAEMAADAVFADMRAEGIDLNSILASEKADVIEALGSAENIKRRARYSAAKGKTTQSRSVIPAAPPLTPVLAPAPSPEPSCTEDNATEKPSRLENLALASGSDNVETTADAGIGSPDSTEVEQPSTEDEQPSELYNVEPTSGYDNIETTADANSEDNATEQPSGLDNLVQASGSDNVETTADAGNQEPPDKKLRRSLRECGSLKEARKRQELQTKIQTESEEGLEMRIVEGIGRVVFTTRRFEKEEYICTYRGKVMTLKVSKSLSAIYDADPGAGSFMLYFPYNNKPHCVDATEENGSLGRLMSHSCSGNAEPKVETSDNGPRPVVILRALKAIEPGTEVTWDYGERYGPTLEKFPWLRK